MVLNASHVPASLSPPHAPYRIFDQENFFNEDIVEIVAPAKIFMEGMSIEQLAEAMRTFGVEAKVVYGSDLSEDSFRQILISVINSDDQFAIINFHRKYLDEVGAGHYSPVAAYDKSSDRFLILDVVCHAYAQTRYKELTNQLTKSRG